MTAMLRVPGLAALSLAAALALAAGTADAQTSSGLKGHDSNADIDVSAEHGTLASRDKRAVLTGNVKAVQTDLTLTADRMTIAYTDDSGTKIQRIDAAGNVIVRSPTETARSPYAIYDLDKKLITMLGGVVLDKPGNEIRSQRLVYDLNSGRANVDSGGVAGGRITGHFTVPQRNNAASPAAPATDGAEKPHP